jgi:hypothetical protein
MLDIPLPDPLTQNRSKLLFDLVDTQQQIGWSAKALQWTVSPGIMFELVIQRADIFKKYAALGFEPLSIASPPDRLGAALLKHGYTKVETDAARQQVKERPMAILLKSADRRQYAYYENALAIYLPEDLEWRWTDATQTGLQGIHRASGQVVFRWYPNQKQLFERFQLPQDAYLFTLEPVRLPMAAVLQMLLQRLNH